MGAELLVLLCHDMERLGYDDESWSAVRVLALASVLSPLLGMPIALPEVDVPQAMREAARSVGGGCDDTTVEARVEAVHDMLLRHLTGPSLARPRRRERSLDLSMWLSSMPLSTAVGEMQAAAWLNRLKLLTERLGPDGSAHYLAATRRWSAADAVERDHPFSFGRTTHHGVAACRPWASDELSG